MRFTPFAALASSGLSIDYLIVAGGGPGESSNQTDYAGYGGGAGGYLTGSSTINFGLQYTISVGIGGFPGNSDVALQSSSFNGLAAGGGYGAVSGPPQSNGSYAGAPVICDGKTVKGGGGGAGITGSAPYCTGGNIGVGGDGGNGLTWFDGNTYAGGGGAGQLSTAQSVGGAGGGGRGAYAAVAPETGTANTGGGGGGGGYNGAGAGGNGGSGIVKIRYAGNPIIQGGTITTTGGYTYHTFLASGTLFT